MKARKGLIEWVGTSKEYNNAMCNYLNEKVEPTFPEPTNPGKNATIAQVKIFSMMFKEKRTDKEEWEESKGRLFRSPVVQLCAPPMKNKLESDPKFTELQKEYNVVGLLDLIKDLVYSIDESQEPIWVMANAMCKLHIQEQLLQETRITY